MPILQRNFLRATLDRDSDNRIIPSGRMRDALNIRVYSSESNDSGAIENCLGNIPLTDLQLTNGKVIGSEVDSSASKIYYFITSDFKDIVAEYSEITGQTIVLLQSSKPNGVLNFSKDYLITGINVIINGDSSKNLLAWTDDRNNPRIINIERAKTYDIDGFIEEDICLIKKPPRFAPTLQLNTTATAENYLEDKFLSFAYRYKYLDGEYSAISSFTNYAFSPKKFNLDYQTMENNGMTNTFNEVVIGFNTGSERVTDIELLFKRSGSNVVNIIEKFNKLDENWEDETTQTFSFANSKTYSALPIDELQRIFDNVPRIAKAQEVIGNRIVFGNYVEGYNIEDETGQDIKLDYSLELSSKDLSYNPLAFYETLAGDPYGSTTLIIDFTGVQLIKGMRINFDFVMTAVGGTGSFTYYFSYILQQDYTSGAVLSNDPHFTYFVEEVMTSIFIANVEVIAPENTIETTYGSFTAGATVSNNIQIKAPAITFLIDDTPLDPNDNPTNTHNEVFGFDFSDATDLWYRVISSDTSLKTNRSYEVGIIYLDEFGRTSTVLTTPENTIYIPQELALSQNKIVVNVNHKPPYWADRYKFVLKQNKGAYNTIYVNFFYEDKLYRWVKLEGANRDKVKEGDSLIVKSDLNGFLPNIVKVRVLEIVSKERDFILENIDLQEEEIIEEAGLYMKIKPVGFNMDLSNNLQWHYNDIVTPTNASGYGTNYIPFTTDGYGNPYSLSLAGYLDTDTGLYVDYPVTIGTRIHLIFEVKERPRGGGGSTFIYNQQHTAQGNHDNFQNWWDAEIVNLGTFEEHVNYYFRRDPDTNQLQLVMSADANDGPSMESTVNILFSKGDLIFETDPKENDTEIFYENGQTFEIINGAHLGNVENQIIGSNPAICEMDSFNCYVQGNGAESYQVKDSVLENFLNIDLRPSTTTLEKYKEVRRYADLTYSAPYNSNTNINGLNEFNLSQANFKDDVEKKYGSIQKLYSRETDLLLFQEGKVSRVLYGKDILSNLDGTTNLSAVETVLAQQIPYSGEYGISRNPESFAFFGNRIYFTDVKRGTPLRLSIDGITEMAQFGMTDFFKDVFRKFPISKYQGGYDPYFDEYILTLGTSDNNYSIGFSEKVKGWTSKYSFVPDKIMGLNNNLYSFKNGQLFIHNSDEVPRNNFYNTQFSSLVEVVFNDFPQATKIFKTLYLDGDNPWEVILKTNLANGTLKKEEFNRREGKLYTYIRGNENEDDLNGVVQGMGNIETVLGNTLTFGYPPETITVGNPIFQVNGSAHENIGTITNINGGAVTIQPTGITPIAGLFCYEKRNSRVDGGDIRGYYMEVILTNDSTEPIELSEIGSNVIKSHP